MTATTNTTARERFDPPRLIGMIHAGALPGTPGHRSSIDELIDAALRDARALAGAGFDGIIVENMHDAPYVHGDRLGPEITAAMTRIVSAVRSEWSGPLGVQILSGGNRAALACCLATGAEFIRCENFVYAHVADEGLLPEAEAGPLLRYRRQIGAERVAILTDLKKKHASHAVTADISIGDAAEAAEFFGSDGFIVTGGFTGQAASFADLEEVRTRSSLPLLVGSGVTPASVNDTLRLADAVIVGSWIKRGGDWRNPVDPARAAELVQAAG